MAKRSRRPQGSGSIYYSDRHKRWIGQIDLGKDIHGKRKRPRVSGKTKRDVGRKLEALKEKYTLISPENAHITVHEFAEMWLDTMKHEQTPSTRHSYQYRLSKILVHVGTMKLIDVRPAHIAQALAQLSGLSGTTRESVFAVFKSMLRSALQWGYISHNPADMVKRPRKDTKEKKPLSIDEVKQLFQVVKDEEEWGAAFVIMILLGLRRGELCGLMWQDIDWDSGIISIERAVVHNRSTDQLELSKLKTKSSHRMLPLLPMVADQLVKQKKATEWLESEMVFPAHKSGAYLNPTSLTGAFKRIAAKADLDITPQILRHTTASLLAYFQVPPKVAQHILGHSDISMTLNTYTHLYGDESAEALKKISGLLTDNDEQNTR